jgi:hypothetical protein
VPTLHYQPELPPSVRALFRLALSEDLLNPAAPFLFLGILYLNWKTHIQ